MVTLPEGILRTPLGVYVLRDDLYLSRWIEEAGVLDIPRNRGHIAAYADRIPVGGTVINAGACLGDHTITYSQLVGAEGRVLAFEPHPVIQQALLLNMARLSNVTVYPLALGAACGVRVFHCDLNIGASGFAEVGQVEVVCETLDHLLPDLQRCDLIHLDAEGAEPQILAGGEALIARCRPVLVLEVCAQHLRRLGSSAADLLALLAAWQYDVAVIPQTVEPILYDVLCHPRP
jgi:FkbM family methyltransferase